eukprot:COSAG02_NODE_1281_length_13472_cov_8.763048_14_plen_108_part_00
MILVHVGVTAHGKLTAPNVFTAHPNVTSTLTSANTLAFFNARCTAVAVRCHIAVTICRFRICTREAGGGPQCGQVPIPLTHAPTLLWLTSRGVFVVVSCRATTGVKF